MGDPSMNYWMGVKYGVQGQNAAAAQTGANAAMVGANGAYLQHVGERGLLDKQAGTWDADAAAKQYGLRTGADAAMQSANAAMTQAQADMERSRHQGALMDSEARLNSQRGSPLSGGALDFMGNNLDRGYLKPPGYAAGTANVQPQSPQYAAPASPETLGALWDHVNGYAAGTADMPRRVSRSRRKASRNSTRSQRRPRTGSWARWTRGWGRSRPHSRGGSRSITTKAPSGCRARARAWWTRSRRSWHPAKPS